MCANILPSTIRFKINLTTNFTITDHMKKELGVKQPTSLVLPLNTNLLKSLTD